MFGIKHQDALSIKLPSNGFVEGVPQSVLIRPIKGKEELKMNSESLPRYIDYIIRSCVKTSEGQSLDPAILLPQDKMYVMMMIRAMTYTNIFKSDYLCRSCGNSNVAEVSINDLDVTYLDHRMEDNLSNITLGSGIVVTLKMLSDSEINDAEMMARKIVADLEGGRDLNEVRELVLRMKRIKSFSYTSEEEGLVTIDCTLPESRPDVQALVEELPAGDHARMDTLINDEGRWGVQVVSLTKCSKCGVLNSAPVSLNSTEFFRPSNM